MGFGAGLAALPSFAPPRHLIWVAPVGPHLRTVGPGPGRDTSVAFLSRHAQEDQPSVAYTNAPLTALARRHLISETGVGPLRDAFADSSQGAGVNTNGVIAGHEGLHGGRKAVVSDEPIRAAVR